MGTATVSLCLYIAPIPLVHARFKVFHSNSTNTLLLSDLKHAARANSGDRQIEQFLQKAQLELEKRRLQ